MSGKDLHYLVTRIINPTLNWVVAAMRSSNKVLYGRDGYTGLRWTNHSISDELADRLEDWRDGLWYISEKDPLKQGKEILNPLFKLLVLIETEPMDEELRTKVLEGLWNMTREIGKYLELGDYVEKKREQIKLQATEIWAKNEIIKKWVIEESLVAKRSRQPVKITESNIVQPPEKLKSLSTIGSQVMIKVWKSKIMRPGRICITEDGWASVVVNGTSLRAYVPTSRLRFLNKNGVNIVEIDEIRDEDIKMWDLNEWKFRECKSRRPKPEAVESRTEKRSLWKKLFR